MIPKIIHYCWLSGERYPESINSCMETWRRILYDYEFVKWDVERFIVSNNKWVEQAYLNKKYAFASDYIRFHAVYNYGGIYLDSDVEVIKSFNDFLHLPYFLGREDTPNLIEAATLGAVAQCPWIKLCLDYYNDRSFEISPGRFDEVELPRIMRDLLGPRIGIKFINGIKEFNIDNESLQLFPVDYFSPKNHKTLKIRTTENSYSIHHFAASWKTPLSIRKKFFRRVAAVIIWFIGAPNWNMLMKARESRQRNGKGGFSKRQGE